MDTAYRQEMARPRKRSATALSIFVDAALARQGLTHNEFSARVDMSPSSLSNLKLREEAPGPGWDLVRTWATVLRLTPAEEAELRDLMELAHSTRYVQDLVADLRQRTKSQAAEEPSSYGAGQDPSPSPPGP